MKVDESFWDKQNETDRKQSAMNCWHCGGEVIWGGDHSFEECGIEDGGEGLVTNLSCSKCAAFALVYLPLPDNTLKETFGE